ncbi:hypothetical protein PUMCH_003233 [Australozyma saopauloensis]|uniref:alpha,alpha-trehalase n=1 Tax=Australozyma saopauloensis TaxID=291208 RepID=A0AAX4HC73_9ASCO|nr:hypothetical protein PUMCH_003233 [[Candida] saopauloensis]
MILLPVLFLSTVAAGFTSTEHYNKLLNTHDNRHIFAQLQYSEKAFFDAESNIVGTLNFVKHHQFQSQPYVANGYIGARIPNLGHGFAYDLLSNTTQSSPEDLNNGWPLFNRRYSGAFVAGFYNLQQETKGSNFPWLSQYGLDSTISSIPQWTTLSIKSADDHELDPALPSEAWGKVSNYSQTLSFEDGIVSTLYVWMDSLHLRYNVSANKEHINVGTVTLEIFNPSEEATYMTITDVLDFETSHDCKLHSLGSVKDGIFIMFSPVNVKNVYGAISSRLSTLANHTSDTESDSASFMKIKNNLRVDIGPKESILVRKTVGIVTSDLDPLKYTLANSVLGAATQAATKHTHENLVTSNKKRWDFNLGRSLKVHFPDDALLTLAARSSLYHLHSNTRHDAEGLTSALGVSGLSSDSYGGQVFWDTDLWMLLGILPFDPQISKSLLNYRLHTHQQAIANIQSPSNPFSLSHGAIYPWTSGRYGNCTATGPCFDYEYHVNTAIAHSAFNLYLSGAVDEKYLRDEIFPLVNDAAQFYSTYVVFNDTLGKYTSHNLTDPDEFANHIDNGAYTNVAISNTIEWAAIIAEHLDMEVPPIYRHIPGNMHIPTSPDDDRVILEYSGMPASVAVKQADVVMMTYPLNYDYDSEAQAQANLDYYAMEQVSTGPAMTFPIFSIVASETLDSGCSSESFLMKSVQPYLRGPFAQFLEQSNDNFESNGGTNPAFPFLTANGGFLQAILRGLLGMRYGHESVNGKLRRFLQFKAHELSSIPKGVFIPEIVYMNQTLALNLSSKALTITNTGSIDDSNDSLGIIDLKVFTGPNEFVKTNLKPHETKKFELLSRKKARVHSLTECGCAAFTNINAGKAGDVTLLMHDGSNSTRWKAGQSSTSKILIDLKQKKKVKAGLINWGSLPPKTLKIHSEKAKTDVTYSKFNNSLDLLAEVSFGSNSGNKSWKQGDMFNKILEKSVEINAPYNETEYLQIKPVNRHNTTEFVLPSDTATRFLIVEINGLHDENVEGGAEIYSIDLF